MECGGATAGPTRSLENPGKFSHAVICAKYRPRFRSKASAALGPLAHWLFGSDGNLKRGSTTMSTDGDRAARFQPPAFGYYLPGNDPFPTGSRAGGEEGRYGSGGFGVAECRVLVADGSPLVMQLLAEMFALSGYPVTSACGPVEAISVLKESHFHLVLIAYAMPLLNGYHLACRVKLEDPRTRVVIMTNNYHDEKDWLLTCSEIDGLLIKPVRISDLSRLISTLAMPNGFGRYDGENKPYPYGDSHNSVIVV
jgi:CheY-like chemotaxis protein